MSFEELITHYGYGALFLGVILEGETVLIAASFAAHQGYLNLGWVMVVGFLGSLAGGQILFLLGRIKGRSFLRNRPAWQARVKKAQQMLDRYERQVLLGFRFMFGFRTIIPFSLGMGETKTDRFSFYNAIGALTWAIVVGFLGFLFGAALEAVLLDVKRYEKWIILALLCVGCAVWAIHLVRKRELAKNLVAPREEDECCRDRK